MLVLKSTKSMFCLFLAYQTNYKYRRYHVGTIGAFNWKPLEGSDCEFGGGKEGLKAWNSWCLGTSKRKQKEYVHDAFSWEQSPIIGDNCFANIIIPWIYLSNLINTLSS